jgi:hypothetical protein
MASEVVTRYLCDRHLIEKDERVYDGVQSDVLGLGLDLCPACREELLGGAIELLAKLTALPKRRGRPPLVPWRARPCPRCADGEREFFSRSSLRTHLKGVHGMTGIDATAVVDRSESG